MTVPAAGLRLEGRLRVPEDPRGGIVVCHPHPQFGGTMDFPVVVAVADALAGAGFAALRFNFRGVGASEGSFADGIGEVDDVRGAVAFLRERSGARTVTVAGYSFGAMVGLRAGIDDPSVDRLVAIAAPVSMAPLDFLAGMAKRALFVHGDRDPYGAIGEIERVVGSLGETAELHRLAGADHFLGGFEEAVAAAVRDFVK